MLLPGTINAASSPAETYARKASVGIGACSFHPPPHALAWSADAAGR